ncbi:unnamed protein product, partial [Staurois parvus]
MQAGRRTKHSGQNVCEMSLFNIFKISHRLPSPIRPDARREQNPEDRCPHRPKEMAGTLQGCHRGSAGQNKCKRDPRATLQCISECSSGLPLLVLK